jgi:hypothetical protein
VGAELLRVRVEHRAQSPLCRRISAESKRCTGFGHIVQEGTNKADQDGMSVRSDAANHGANSWEECQASFLALSTEFIHSLPERNVGLPSASSSFDADSVKLPEDGIPFDAVVGELRHNIMPKLSAQRGPRYLAYVTGGSTPIATMADWLVSVFDQNVKKDGCSAASQVERQTLQWLTELFMLPSEFRGVFTTGT